MAVLNGDRHLTPEQAAEFLGCTRNSLANFRCRQRGPRFIKLMNGRIRYRLADLQAYQREGASLRCGTHDQGVPLAEVALGS